MACLGLLGFALAAAQTPGGQEPGAERQAALELLRDEAARIERRLAETAGRALSLQGEVERLGLELALQEQRTREARAAVELAALRLEVATEEATQLEASLIRARQVLRERLLALYRTSRRGRVQAWFEALRPADPLPALRWTRFTARRDGRAVVDARRAAEDLTERRERIRGERDASHRWLAEEDRRRRQLTTLHARQAALLDRAAAESRALGDRAGDLRDKESRLETLLSLVAGDASSATQLAGRPITDFRGVLDWPVSGARVSVPFGPRLDPRYRTRTPHPGVGLEVAEGSAVRAVFPGRVLYAGAFEGYGNLVVVRHAGQVLSLYAGLRALRAEAGLVVPLNGLVGESSATLYLEFRQDGRPEDPMRWLRAPSAPGGNR